MAFTWTADMLTGNTLIDSEHQALIDGANALLDACKQGKGHQELERTVDFLVQYTHTHFSHEEALQIQYHYPTYTQHKKFHTEYLKLMDELATKLKKQGATIVMVVELNAKMTILISHIKTEDVNLAKYLQAQGV